MKKLHDFWQDEQGAVVSIELILIVTVLVLGVMAGLSTLSQAVVGELRDVSHAVRSFDQSYYFGGFRGCHSGVAGSAYLDVRPEGECDFAGTTASVTAEEAKKPVPEKSARTEGTSDPKLRSSQPIPHPRPFVIPESILPEGQPLPFDPCCPPNFPHSGKSAFPSTPPQPVPGPRDFHQPGLPPGHTGQHLKQYFPHPAPPHNMPVPRPGLPVEVLPHPPR